MDTDNQIPEKYLQACRLDGPEGMSFDRSIPDIQNHMGYKDNVEFYLEVVQEDGTDGLVIKLNVVGLGDDGYEEVFNDLHEFEDCLDFKHVLFEQPIVLASLRERLRGGKLADLGRQIVELYMAWATKENSWGTCFIVADTSHVDGEEDKKLWFTLTVGNSNEIHLTLPWSYASKYFVVPSE